MKKFLSLLLCAVMLSTMFVSFAAAETTYPEYLNLDSYYPMVKDEYKDQVELNFAIIVSNDFSENPQDRYFWQMMEKVFNIKCNVTQVTNREEYITLTFAADDLPDIILGAGLNATQLYNFGVVEGQLLDVAPYITPELAPQMTALFEKYPDTKAGITLPNGAIYAFPYMIARDNPETYAVSSVNVDLLKDLGYEEKPHTLEKVVEMLYAMKEKYGDEIIPLAGNWANDNPSGLILRALGYEVANENDKTGTNVTVRNGEVVLPGADATYKEYLKLMNQFYNDGIIDKDFLTSDKITLQAQTAEKKIGFLGNRCYITNPDPAFYLQFESLPVLTSEFNDHAFAVGNNYYSFGGCVISAKTQYPELLVRWADWMMTSEGTNAAWVGSHKDNEKLMLDGWGGWYMDENYSRRDVDRDNNPDKWTGAVEYLRKEVAGFNMGSLGFVIEENEYRQSMSGLPLRLPQDTWALDPNNAGFYYRTNAYEEYTPYLVTALSTLKFFFDEDTSDRLNELESVLRDYITNQTARFITGTRSLDEFDQYLEEVNRLGAQEYVGYYADAYASYTEHLAEILK